MLKKWTPSGLRSLSSVVGIAPSTNGATAPRWSMCASWEGTFGVLAREAELHRAGVVVLQVLPWIRDEIGQLRHRQVDLHHTRARLPCLDVGNEVSRELVLVQQLEERDLRMDAAHDRGRPQLFTAFEGDSHRATALNEDPPDTSVRSDLAPGGDRRS